MATILLSYSFHFRISSDISRTKKWR